MMRLLWGMEAAGCTTSCGLAVRIPEHSGHRRQLCQPFGQCRLAFSDRLLCSVKQQLSNTTKEERVQHVSLA